MSVDQLKPDYPEHLNPFHKRSNTLTRSFRGLKKAIVRSFTGKDKEKPTIRPKPVAETVATRNVFSMPPGYYSEPQIAFPRSRFSERLSKTDALRSATLGKRSSLGNGGHNPFEDGDDKESKANKSENATSLSPPVPAERKKLKRRKKRAPIPPGSESGSVSGSKWSLVSTESEMSSMCYSENEIEYIDGKNTDIENEEILKITREIAKFTEDTNNNSIRNALSNENNERTDKANERDDNDVKDALHSDAKTSGGQADQTREDRDPDSPLKLPAIPTSPLPEDDDDNFQKSVVKTDLETGASYEEISIKVPNIYEENKTKIDDSEQEDVSVTQVAEDPNETLNKTSMDVASSSDTPSVKMEMENQKSDSDSKLRNETNTDEEIEKEFVVLQLDNKDESITTEPALSIKGTIEFFESTSSSPTPKVRKNILTKEKLLGSEET